MNLLLNAAEAIGSNAGMISVKTGVQPVDQAYIRSIPEAAELSPGDTFTSKFAIPAVAWTRSPGQRFRPLLHHEIYRARARAGGRQQHPPRS